MQKLNDTMQTVKLIISSHQNMTLHSLHSTLNRHTYY